MLLLARIFWLSGLGLLSFLVLLAEEVQGETQWVPNIGIAERYDSNVLMVRKSAVPPGIQQDDIVTTVSPRLQVQSRDGVIDSNLIIGAMAEAYLHNPDLGYVGGNGSLNLGLTSFVARFVQNLTLNLRSTFMYTPQPPAFLSPGQDSQNPYIRGVQTYRANTLMYSVGEAATYQISPRTAIQSSYTYNKVEYGHTFVAAAGTALIGTTSNQVTLRPTFQVSEKDTITNAYTFNQYEQVGVGSFRTQTETLGVISRWSPHLGMQANAGIQYLQAITSSAGTQSSDTFSPTGSVFLAYASHAEFMGDMSNLSSQFPDSIQMTNDLLPGWIGSAGSYSLRVAYSYGAYPLLVGNGGLSQSHVFTGAGTLGLSSNLTATYGGGFSRTSQAGQDLIYETVLGNLGLNYLITPALRGSLTYSYTHSYGVGNSPTNLGMNRELVMMNFTYAFAGGSQFFQGGGYVPR